MDQSRAPIYEALIQHHTLYESGKAASFHIPGHKFGAAASSVSIYQSMMTIDVTEITGMDDLHAPESIILEAQQLAAELFHADHTFFLVNGSTSGNLALILALCKPGDKLIVQRNVHKSVLHGLMLAQAQAVFVAPCIDQESGTAYGIEPEALQDALQAHPEAKGVLLTNPSYYGISADLIYIADLVHEYNLPLIVDEAHAAHFGHSDDLPASALLCGADAVVQSTHKMLTALTMGAMLHLKGRRVPVDEVGRMLSIVQSSSPSYPIMASLDLARKHLFEAMNENRFQHAIQFSKQLQSLCAEYEWLRTIGHAAVEQQIPRRDPFKILLSDRTGRWSGYALQAKLEEQGCYVEMADYHHVVLALSLVQREEDRFILKRALDGITATRNLEEDSDSDNTKLIIPPPFTSSLEPVPFSLHMNRELEAALLLPVEETVGHRSAEMVIPYPPGIPILYPNELITEETSNYILALVSAGAKFHHTNGQSPRLLKVKSSSF